ncbi:MAG: selenide, water dikinase SelD [Miltoncostaeaceae bacterium]
MARGAGCGCKLDPGLLLGALAAVPPPPSDPRLLVGNQDLDDAAVYRLDDDTAIVATADFFTPVVDDPETFGAIAATNALSDLYAMGASPIMALALVAYPADGDQGTLGRIMAGGARVAAAAGCPVVGGHSIDDPEPKYGLCAIGTASPDRLLRNDRGRPGDLLLLTKPLGVGIVVAAHRAGAIAPIDLAVEAMLRSNAAASCAALEAGAVCATDVTGNGLLGHLREIAAASRCAARLEASAAPALPGVASLAADGHGTGGGRRNLAFLGDHLDIDAGVEEHVIALLVDPQTSGGLLIAAPTDVAAQVCRNGVDAVVIGSLTAGEPGRVTVTP